MVSDQCDSGNFWFIYGHDEVFHSKEHLIAVCVGVQCPVQYILYT